MRILILCHEFFPGAAGGAQGVGHLATALAGKHHVDVITKRYPGLPSKQAQGNLTVYRVPAFGQNRHGYASIKSTLCYAFFAIVCAACLFLRHSYDILNGHFGIPAGAIAVWLGRVFRVPSVVTLAGAEIYDPPESDRILAVPLVKRVVGWTIRSADVVVGVSRSMIQHVHNDFGISRSCQIVPWGIPEIRELKTHASRSTRSNEVTLKLLCVARLVQRKRHIDLLRSLTFLPSYRRVTLLLVGDGPERERLVTERKRLGLESCITVAGHLSDHEKWEAYSGSDAFVLVSNHECQGLVYLEAMQAGLPIIAGDDGGQLDFIIDGLNGFIVPVGDARALSGAIEKMAGSVDLRKRMGEESSRIAGKLTAAETMARYEGIFEQACRIRREKLADQSVRAARRPPDPDVRS